MSFFALKADCYFRRYGEIGYIVRPIVGMEEVVEEVGAIFLETLGYAPRDFEEIVAALVPCFSGVELDELREDALEFFEAFVADGFLTSSDTLEDFREEGFDYSTLEGRFAVRPFTNEEVEASEIFLEDYFKGHAYLQTLHIEVTSKCNERCIHCYIPHEEKITQMDADLMLEVLRQCRAMGVLTVVFSGGEAMLHPAFTEFVKEAKELDLNVTVLSNLTILTDEIIEVLKYRHTACVNVSLYAMRPEIHDAITKLKGSFEKTKKNILRLIENNIAVQISLPIMKENKDCFWEVINWGQDHKCTVVSDYLIMARSDRSVDNLVHRLTEEDLYEVVEGISKHSLTFINKPKSEGVFAYSQTAFPEPDQRVCGVGLTTMCMVASGKIYPCAGWQEYVCGDASQQTLQEIWESSKQLQYLRSLRMRSFEKCMKCEDYKYCLMCLSTNYNESSTGSIFEIPSIVCKAGHINHAVADKAMLRNKTEDINARK